MPVPSQGNRTVHVPLMEHINGTNLRIFVPVPNAKAICDAHKLAIINMALNLNLDAFTRGVYPLEFQPRNVILRRPQVGRCFFEKEDCLVRSEVDLDDVRDVLVDLGKVRAARRNRIVRKYGFRVRYTYRCRERLEPYRTTRPSTAVYLWQRYKGGARIFESINALENGLELLTIMFYGSPSQTRHIGRLREFKILHAKHYDITNDPSSLVNWAKMVNFMTRMCSDDVEISRNIPSSHEYGRNCTVRSRQRP
ncbi:uncharacterized protein EV420DRAFT_1586965 [Desarmillaria tabescens]|uniref:Uncharacterized protein n=1 Tax=Armillaria tabescens TaxID=1929756 RepID=A0AA39J850_ARMTA|nr:uncharacterized protein EV420DRAFT_1586965 [Desarmillaria tabescens]KAK0437920.1 hypothetical protein EV420DRAFT_1586965 [Desarmillaria tabescens]